MSNQYKIIVRTGDRPKAGTNSNVHIKLHGDNGKSSDVTYLDVWWRDDFERGREDTFSICDMPFSTIDYIELGRDAAGWHHEWFIDTISIINETTGVKTVFPIFRWIIEHIRYEFIPLDTSLPQDDNRAEQRQKDLTDKRPRYQLEAKAPGLPMQLKSLPADEDFSFQTKWDLGAMTTQLKAEIIAIFTELQTKKKIAVTGRWKSIEELKMIYELGKESVLPPPESFDRYKDDVEFGRQRLAGTNNIWIRMCTEIPNNLAVTEAMVKPFLEGTTLSVAFQQKKIFYIDFSILDTQSVTDGMVLCAPIALFYQRKNGHLVPIAIQLYQKPAEDNPVFLPSDPEYTWIMAKMWFNLADSTLHQSIAHLGFTHLIMEGFCAITHRTMSLSHPLFKLLAPHFLYIHAINAKALNTLVNPGGFFDTNMNIGMSGAFQLIARYKKKWRIDVEGTLPADLKERGVDSPDVLPGYHFRDDAMLLYNAIKKYVCKYLSVYYSSNDAVVADNELQNWRKEMVASEAEGGLSIIGVPGADGGFKTTEDVALVLASVIYTCSVGHAGANFKQYDEYCFPLSYPTQLLGVPPKSKEPLTESHIMEATIGQQGTTFTMSTVAILSKRSTQALGNFEVDYVFDPKALPVIEAFRKDLSEISKTIRAHNITREVAYPYLDPAEIPNSISI